MLDLPAPPLWECFARPDQKIQEEVRLWNNLQSVASLLLNTETMLPGVLESEQIGISRTSQKESIGIQNTSQGIRI
jgi:hypothetical protein